MTHRESTHQLRRVSALLAVGLTVLTACGDSDTAPAAGPSPQATAASTMAPTTPPATAATTTEAVPDTTEAVTATEPTTAAPTTEAECTSNCPITESERSAIEAMIDTYNVGDWQAWLATLTDEMPTWATPVGNQSTELVQFDFNWSASLNEVWTLGDCVQRPFDIYCAVTIEDDFHRGIAVLDIGPSECSIAVRVEDGLVDLLGYDLYPCHEDYDNAWHGFGGWFETTHPGDDPIHGVHYRGWNQTDPEAPARAAAALPGFLEWVNSRIEGTSEQEG